MVNSHKFFRIDQVLTLFGWFASPGGCPAFLRAAPGKKNTLKGWNTSGMEAPKSINPTNTFYTRVFFAHLAMHRRGLQDKPQDLVPMRMG
jgi:hypothetical protein